VPRELPLDHLCPWREEAERLREQLTVLQGQMAALERYVFGKKTERLPSVEQQLRHEQAEQAEQGVDPILSVGQSPENLVGRVA